MTRFTSRRKISYSIHAMAAVCALSLALPAVSTSAPWLAPASNETLHGTWVKQIDNELRSPKYRDVLENALGNVPQASIIKYLNEADAALTDGRKELAQDYVNRAIFVLDRGVQRGWFSKADVEPMKHMIQAKADAAMKGKSTEGDVADERWTGYTHHRPLGITERLDLAAPPTRAQDEQNYESTEKSGEKSGR